MTDIASSTPAERLRAELELFFRDFSIHLSKDGLREKVLALVPAFNMLTRLGSSLLDPELALAGKTRLLEYFRRYPRVPISGDELMVVSGIQEWPRRIRELRVQEGWTVITGLTAKEMHGEGELDLPDVAFEELIVTDYILIAEAQDRDAAHRWHVANKARRGDASVRDKILAYLRVNVGVPVSGEELRYVAAEKTEWARRVRELRTEEGWPVVTRNTGRPDLPVGMYVLEADRQGYAHDRVIPDNVRVKVLERDGFACRDCSWGVSKRQVGDPRQFLELHHLRAHADGGEQTVENLITLCNVHHDARHR